MNERGTKRGFYAWRVDDVSAESLERALETLGAFQECEQGESGSIDLLKDLRGVVSAVASVVKSRGELTDWKELWPNKLKLDLPDNAYRLRRGYKGRPRDSPFFLVQPTIEANTYLEYFGPGEGEKLVHHAVSVPDDHLIERLLGEHPVLWGAEDIKAATNVVGRDTKFYRPFITPSLADSYKTIYEAGSEIDPDYLARPNLQEVHYRRIVSNLISHLIDDVRPTEAHMELAGSND